MAGLGGCLILGGPLPVPGSQCRRHLACLNPQGEMCHTSDSSASCATPRAPSDIPLTPSDPRTPLSWQADQLPTQDCTAAPESDTLSLTWVDVLDLIAELRISGKIHRHHTRCAEQKTSPPRQPKTSPRVKLTSAQKNTHEHEDRGHHTTGRGRHMCK